MRRRLPRAIQRPEDGLWSAMQLGKKDSLSLRRQRKSPDDTRRCAKRQRNRRKPTEADGSRRQKSRTLHGHQSGKRKRRQRNSGRGLSGNFDGQRVAMPKKPHRHRRLRPDRWSREQSLVKAKQLDNAKKQQLSRPRAGWLLAEGCCCCLDTDFKVQQRRFKFARAVGKVTSPTTGIPQGLSSSVLEAIVMIYFLLCFFEGSGLQVEAFAWFDNVQWVSSEPETIPAAFALLEKWVAACDMELKPSACWTWTAGPEPQRAQHAKRARYTPPNSNKPVPHRDHARELGAHLNYGWRRIAPTAVKRGKGARDFCKLLRGLPLPPKVKGKMVRGGAINKTIWGCEATVISPYTIRDVRTEIVRSLRTKGDKGKTKRNPVLSLYVRKDRTLDPKEALIQRRIFSNRRWIAKRRQQRMADLKTIVTAR